MDKICRICNEYKDILEFYKRGDKYRSECKICLSKRKKENYSVNKNDINFINKCRESAHRYKSSNKDIVNKKRRDKYKVNKEQELIKSKEYYKNNKDKKMSRRRQYRIENKDILNSKQREYIKLNPLYKLKCNLRTLIGNSIRNMGYSKKSKTEDILGCSFIEFKYHIESLFIDGMSFDNRNCWHIDHIVPLSFAINEFEILMLNHYKNLRPIWVVDNLSKSDEITIKNETYYKIVESRNKNKLVDEKV
jgi:hypothetical protein